MPCLDHALHCLVAGFGEHFGVAAHFAADEDFQAGSDIATHVFGAHGISADHPQVLRDGPADDSISGSDQQHTRSLERAPAVHHYRIVTGLEPG